MTIELLVFDYKIIGYKDKPPRLVDFAFLNIEEKSPKIHVEYISYGIMTEKVTNGHNITVWAKIGVPCHKFQNTPEGLFQYYEGETTYFTNIMEKPIPSASGELVLNHFGKMSSAIFIHTYGLTRGSNFYSIQPPCLAKVILQLENEESNPSQAEKG